MWAPGGWGREQVADVVFYAALGGVLPGFVGGHPMAGSEHAGIDHRLRDVDRDVLEIVQSFRETESTARFSCFPASF